MTPKEKATQLVDEFSNECLLTKEGGKVAALIAVYQILELYYPIMTNQDEKIFNYWYEVKNEIEKL
jgi:hypothetical protein